MAFGDPPVPDFQPRPWSDQLPMPLSQGDTDTQEQWLFLFNEHMLLTVQAIHRLHQAMSGRMLGPVQQ